VELVDYLRILIKRGWLILLAIVIGVTGAFAISKVQTPEYRSTIYLNVWPGRLDWGLQQTVKGLMRNYAGIIRSRSMAEDVSRRLELDMAPDTLMAAMTVSSIESDFMIRIDVDTEEPLISRDIAQTSAELFVEDITAYMLNQDKQDRVEVSIRDYALPGTLHKPKLKINVLAGALFGLVLGVVVLFVLEWLQADIIRTSDDLEEQAGLAVLGVIPVSAAASRAVRRRNT
jgi:capsular polysaccharide biosynthesis protein